MQLRDETGRPDPPPILDLVSAWLAALMQRDKGRAAQSLYPF